MQDRILKLPEVAELLGVHIATVRKWCNENYLPYARTPGGHRRWRLNDVLEFLSKESKNLDKIELSKKKRAARDFLHYFCDDPKDEKKVMKIITNNII